MTFSVLNLVISIEVKASHPEKTPFISDTYWVSNFPKLTDIKFLQLLNKPFNDLTFINFVLEKSTWIKVEQSLNNSWRVPNSKSNSIITSYMPVFLKK